MAILYNVIAIAVAVLSAACVVASPGPAPCDPSGPNANFPFCNASLTHKVRLEDLVGRLAKLPSTSIAGLFTTSATGVPELNLPPYQWWSEGLHGVAYSPGVNYSAGPVPASTSFPQVCLTAASFNRSLFSSIGNVVGREGRAMNNYGQAGLTFWAPNINIFRDPRWGRGQETPGEDPYLTSTYARHFVSSMQRDASVDPHHLRVSSCCKHFTAYDVENWGGQQRYWFDAIVSDHDMWDTFMPSFEACVHPDGGASSAVMCSYNAVNGVPMCANDKLLAKLPQWGFEGYITSDCGAVGCVLYDHNYTKTHDTTLNATLGAGMDIDCGGMVQQYFPSAADNGTVPAATWKRALTDQFGVLMRLGYFDPVADQPYKTRYTAADVSNAEAEQLALHAAEEGIVLLRNVNDTLPLNSARHRNIAVMGPHADSHTALLGNYYGHPPYIVSPRKGVEAYAANVQYLRGVGVQSEDASGFEAACELAKRVDHTILVMGLDQNVEAEGLDRYSIRFPGLQSLFITHVAACSPTPITVVVMSGGSVDYSDIVADPNVGALLWTGYPGQSGGTAIANVLYGAVSPSGRLPHTVYPGDYVDQVSMLDMQMEANASTGSPGRTYRYYTGTPVYPFAWGITYTNWSLIPVNFSTVKTAAQAQHALDAGKFFDDVHLFALIVNVTNLGSRDAAFSALLKVTDIDDPANVGGTLCDFDKVFVRAGKSVLVTLRASSHGFLRYSAIEGRRMIVKGAYRWHVLGYGGDVAEGRITIA